MRLYQLFLYLLVAVCALPFTAIAEGQFVSEQDNRQVDEDTPPNNIFVLHPAHEPSPALKYRLLPDFLELRPGNAAVYYGKVTAEQLRFFRDQELQSKILDMTDAPLDKVRESAEAANATPDAIYHQLRLAALCESCDWQIPIRHEPFYQILLPELQQTRWFGRLLAVRARYQISHGRYDDAIETLQTGYAIARHDATGPTYIHLLVAIAVKTAMDQQLETLIQQPDAPNMYWAIASMPDPFLSIRASLEAELHAVELNFPDIHGLSIERLGDHSDEFWRQQLTKLVDKESWMGFVAGENLDHPKDPEQYTALVTLGRFPQARRQLIESGISLESIDKLPPSQVVLIAGVRELEWYHQDVMKWSYLPYSVALDRRSTASRRLEASASHQILEIADIFAPAVQQISAAIARSERQSAVLQMVEAVRMFAAENNGRLPDKLEAIDSAPVPNDPVSGLPFQYVRDHDHLSITGPRLPSGPLDIKLKVSEQ